MGYEEAEGLAKRDIQVVWKLLPVTVALTGHTYSP